MAALRSQKSDALSYTVVVENDRPVHSMSSPRGIELFITLQSRGNKQFNVFIKCI